MKLTSTVKKTTHQPARTTSANGEKSKGFTSEERAGMKERIQDLKVDEADGESSVLDNIADITEPDRLMVRRLHAIIKASAPDLAPRL